MSKHLEKQYPLLHDAKLLKRVGQAATAPLQIYGTQADQREFQKMVSPGLFLELLDYWFKNDGKKLDYRN